MNFTIFDIGGSFLKIYNSKNSIIKRIKMFEDDVISLYELKKLIKENINSDTDYICFSSQMHGFVLFDENNNNLSDFITWKKKSEICILNNHILNLYIPQN
jgi:excinuclease UvrABC helicase subunit UvrB